MTFLEWAAGSGVSGNVFFNGSPAANIGAATLGTFGPDSPTVFDGTPAARIGTAAEGTFTVGTTSTSVTVDVGGSTVRIIHDTIRITDRIEEPSKASLTIRTDPGVRFPQGTPIEILSPSNAVLFRGYVQRSNRRPAGDDPAPAVLHGVQCLDQHFLLETVTIAEAYPNGRVPAPMTVGDIVADLVTEYLEAKGILLANATIDSGPPVEAAVFNYRTAGQVLRDLAQRADMWFRVDYDKNMFFVARETFTAPFTLDGTRFIDGSLALDDFNPRYRNAQYQVGGRDTTDLQIEQVKGDGKTRSFPVGFPIVKEPLIEVDTGAGLVAKTVGIKGVETGKQFYWTKGSEIVTQDTSETILDDTDDFVQVSYFGEYQLVTRSEDAAEIAAQLARQDNVGDGVVEAVDLDTSPNSRQESFEKGASALQKYARPAGLLSYDTLEAGLEPGQQQVCNLPSLGITPSDEALFIEEIEVRVLMADPVDVVIRNVRCAQGPSTGSWVQFFRTPYERKSALIDALSIGEGQILVSQIQFNEGIHIDEQLTITTNSCPVPATTLHPSTSLLPC